MPSTVSTLGRISSASVEVPGFAASGSVAGLRRRQRYLPLRLSHLPRARRPPLRSPTSNLIIDNLRLWTAKDTGIFERSGLNVDLQYIANTNAMAAFLVGQVQVASTGGSEVINSVANGADLVVVATLTPVYSVSWRSDPRSRRLTT